MIITVHNAKGGCGKTTTAFNLSAQLFKSNHKFLLIDLDKQQDLSRLYLSKPSKLSFLEILTDNLNSDLVILKSDRYNFLSLDLLPSSDSFQKIYTELQSNYYLTDQFLSELSMLEKQYGIVLIDCSNNLGILEDLIFKISDLIIIPINPGMNVIYDSMRAIEHINRAKKNPYLTKSVQYKVLLNSFSRPKYSNEPSEQREIREYAYGQFKGNIFDTIVKEYAHFTRSEVINLPVPYLLKDDETYSILLSEIFKTLGVLSFKNKSDEGVNNVKA